jgi:hypothetical protein
VSQGKAPEASVDASQANQVSEAVPAQGNGREPSDALPGAAEAVSLDAARDHEASIAQEARQIREAHDGDGLDVALLDKLLPLLRAPIPHGYIEQVPATKGKPYPSTGIRSVQVQIDRMDNVLRPWWWVQQVEYSEGGKLCRVLVTIGAGDATFLFREAWGGVNQGSTLGNIYKGSYTNAAKLAFARVGVGHEIYIGALDFDPDVDKSAAEAQDTQTDQAPRQLPDDAAQRLQAAVTAAGLDEHLPAKLRQFAAESLTDLTVEQAVKVYEWAQGSDA